MENNNTHKHNLSASIFFLLLGRIISLIVAFVSAASILFQGINRLIPDASGNYYNMSTSLQNAIAFFIVSIIVLCVLEVIDKKSINKNNELLSLPLRKWLLISVLFILGLVILGDLIAIIRYFLSGEITNRFISKVLSLLMLSSIVFIYYYHVLTWDTAWSKKSRKVFSIIGIVISVLILIFGFYLTGSPKTQRNIRIDQERENMLQSINYSISDYWQRYGTMPATLNDLNKISSIFTDSNNPVDSSVYTYKIIDIKNQKYELCSVFNFSTETIKKYMSPTNYVYETRPSIDFENPNNWTHDAGNFCFTKKVDTVIYPYQKPEPLMIK